MPDTHDHHHDRSAHLGSPPGSGQGQGQHTTLTPQMERMFSRESSKDPDQQQPPQGQRTAGSKAQPAPSSSSSSPTAPPGSASSVRRLVLNCLRNGVTGTACILADRLLRMADSCLSDVVLFARCFQCAGEPRRCLAALEHKGMLGAQVITDLSELLAPKSLSDGAEAEAEAEVPVFFFDYLGAVHLAAQCLLELEQYEDCVHLLDPLLFLDSSDEAVGMLAAKVARNICTVRSTSTGAGTGGDGEAEGGVNLMASIYCIAGRCSDMLDSRPRAVACLSTAVRVDPACTEAVEYIVSHGLLPPAERQHLYDTLSLQGGGGSSSREWLRPYYKFQLLDDSRCSEDDEEAEAELLGLVGSGSGATNSSSSNSNNKNGNAGQDMNIDIRLSSIALVRRAERLYEAQHSAEAYRLARQAYIMDPFDTKGLLIYIACMVEMSLTTELFYLGHELSNAYPKLSSSWYCVGCYYWSCRKLEHAQKYLQKAVKLDKRFALAWVVLGHVLAAQEESEHAISAFRSASRLLPGNHFPLVHMAKELVRTNYLSLALHLLFVALRIRPQDPLVLNELGVVYLRQDRSEEALEHLSLASSILRADHTAVDGGAAAGVGQGGRSHGDEVFSNYATALRRAKRFHEATEWYQLCLSVNPTDAGTHANLGFTFHLMGRHEAAIEAYHQALALQPTFSFAADMLSRAMEDYTMAGDGDGGDERMGAAGEGGGGVSLRTCSSTSGAAIWSSPTDTRHVAPTSCAARDHKIIVRYISRARAKAAVKLLVYNWLLLFLILCLLPLVSIPPLESTFWRPSRSAAPPAPPSQCPQCTACKSCTPGLCSQTRNWKRSMRT